MKRFKILLICLVLFGALFLFALTASAYALGDVNNDHHIEIGDARLALRAALELEHYEPGSISFYAADVNFNGKIDTADARIILRVCLGLQQFEQRQIPEIPGLTKEEEDVITEAARQCTVIIRKTRFGTSGDDSFGIVLDADGLVLTTRYAVFGAESLEALTLDGKPLEIREILAYNSAVVLLRLQGSFAAPGINSEYAPGDGVFYNREPLYPGNPPSPRVCRGVILTGAFDPGENWDTDLDMISMYRGTVDNNQYPFGLPLMDTRGDVLGIVCQNYNNCLRAASIASCLDLLKDAKPMSVADFCTEMSRTVITPDFTEITLFPGALALCRCDISGPNFNGLAFSSDSEYVQVLPVQDNYLNRAVLLKVKGFGPDAHISFWSEGDAENSTVTVTVHIADPEKDAALINYAGLTAPDFGALFGVATMTEKLSWNSETGYVSGDFEYSAYYCPDAETVLSAYAYLAAQMGFEYKDENETWEYVNGHTKMLTKQTFSFHRTAPEASLDVIVHFRLVKDHVEIYYYEICIRGSLFPEE